MEKIGVFGGTFDPFHYGHLSIAVSALEEYGLDKIVLMPSHIQPFKIGKKTASAKDRVNMTRLIADEHKDFLLSTKEAFSRGISYTYKTMNWLRKKYPGRKFFFIIGIDSFMSIEKWYKAEELIRGFPFIVGQRPGYGDEETKAFILKLKKRFNAEIGFLNNEILDISSTEIKARIRAGKSISEMVPESVERYIFEHGLYQ